MKFSPVLTYKLPDISAVSDGIYYCLGPFEERCNYTMAMKKLCEVGSRRSLSSNLPKVQIGEYIIASDEVAETVICAVA